MPNATAPPADVATNIAILLERSATQGERMNEMSADLKATREAIATTYATKSEVSDVREDVRGIKNSLGWVVKIVVGAVLVAVLGLVIAKGGVVHP